MMVRCDRRAVSYTARSVPEDIALFHEAERQLLIRRWTLVTPALMMAAFLSEAAAHVSPELQLRVPPVAEPRELQLEGIPGTVRAYAITPGASAAN